MSEEKDSFSIGSAATQVNIKVYFDDIHSEEAQKKIERAIWLFNQGIMASRRVK